MNFFYFSISVFSLLTGCNEKPEKKLSGMMTPVNTILKNCARYFLLIAVCLFLNACHKKMVVKEGEIVQTKETTFIKVRDASFESPLDISPYLDTIKYVKLELTDESIIGYIQKLSVHQDRIYILDTQTSSLFVFDIDGNFIFKICDVGQGPKEYINLDFFEIDTHNNQIVLTDLEGYHVIRYDLDGNYINKKKIPFWNEGIAPIHDDGYVMYANYRDNSSTLEQNYNLIYFDSTMNITKAYFPYTSNNSFKLSTPQSSVFYPFNGDIYFFSGYGDSIYKIGKEGLSLSYVFDFGDKAFDVNRLDEPDPKDYIKNRDYYSLYCIQETDQILSFSLSEPSLPMLQQGFYFKGTKNLLYSFYFTLGDDYAFPVPAIAAYDSWLIAELSVDGLLSMKQQIQKYKVGNKFLQEKEVIVNNLSIDDNSVLMFYKLKQF